MHAPIAPAVPGRDRRSTRWYTHVLLILWVVYLVAGPIYVFESGLPQPADIFMGVVMLALFTGYFARVPLHPTLYLVAFSFLGLVAIVNWLWWTQYQDPKFLLSSVFYLYNFGIMMVVLILMQEFDARLLAATRAGLIAALLLQLGIMLLFPDFRGIRAIGTFNNPNQLGYWTLLTGACLLSLKSSSASGHSGARIGPFDLALLCALGYIAANSLSKAAMVAFVVLAVTGLYLQGLGARMKLAVAVLFVAGVVSVSVSGEGVQAWLAEGWTGRAIDRFEDIGRQQDDSLAGRGYDRIWEYPEYLLFGAGEGGPERFMSRAKEIHSTFATVLFSYGILGMFLFLGLLWLIFRHAERRHLAYFVPVCLYGLTHQGLRFSLLWVFLGVVLARTLYEARMRPRVRRHPLPQVQAVAMNQPAGGRR